MVDVLVVDAGPVGLVMAAELKRHGAYVVGYDGAHSTVRHVLGIAFEGEAYPVPFMLGDVPAERPTGADLSRGDALRSMVVHENGPPDLFIAIPLLGHGRYRVSMVAPPLPEEKLERRSPWHPGQPARRDFGGATGGG